MNKVLQILDAPINKPKKFQTLLFKNTINRGCRYPKMSWTFSIPVERQTVELRWFILLPKFANFSRILPEIFANKSNQLRRWQPRRMSTTASQVLEKKHSLDNDFGRKRRIFIGRLSIFFGKQVHTWVYRYWELNSQTTCMAHKIGRKVAAESFTFTSTRQHGIVIYFLY